MIVLVLILLPFAAVGYANIGIALGRWDYACSGLQISRGTLIFVAIVWPGLFPVWIQTVVSVSRRAAREGRSA